MKIQIIYTASDHAGFKIKEKLTNHLSQKGFEVLDLGPHTDEKVDYPDLADKLCKEVISHKDSLGVLLCGSGQGMAMRANKHPLIRAALCWNEESARLARAHNQANVLCLGARVLDEVRLLKISEIFFNTEFQGGRHQSRVRKISTPI